MTWHRTTPRSFECQPGCLCCCLTTFFFPSEAEACPAEIKDALTVSRGLIQLRRRPPGVCVFFDQNQDRHCGISAFRPLRCRLYPYLPVITPEGIVIVAEPLWSVSPPAADLPEWYRCYGLGSGPNVESQVEEMSREFLEKAANEYPYLLQGLWVDDIDQCINQKEVRKSRQPRYARWDTEIIRHAAQEESAVTALPIG